MMPLLGLLADELGLLGLLLLMHDDGIFYLVLLLVPLIPHLCDAVTVLSLSLVLQPSCFLLLHLPLVVLILETHDFSCSALGFIDFLPSLHLFLLEECDTVCKQLCISLGAAKLS